MQMLTLSIAGRPIEGYMATGLKMFLKDLKLKNSLTDEFFGEDITRKKSFSIGNCPKRGLMLSVNVDNFFHSTYPTRGVESTS